MAKRRPSGYNLFIRECMRKDGDTPGQPMKVCAATYKQMSDKEKARYKELTETCEETLEGKWQCPTLKK